MKISYIEVERMKIFKVGIKIDYQAARGNFPPAMLFGIKRYLSIPNEEDKKFLKTMYTEEEIMDIVDQSQKTLNFFQKAKYNIRKGVAKMFNIRVNEGGVEIFEYCKFRDFAQVYPLIMLVGKMVGWLYAENKKGMKAREVVAITEKFLQKGIYKGMYHYDHKIKEAE